MFHQSSRFIMKTVKRYITEIILDDFQRNGPIHQHLQKDPDLQTANTVPGNSPHRPMPGPLEQQRPGPNRLPTGTDSADQCEEAFCGPDGPVEWPPAENVAELRPSSSVAAAALSKVARRETHRLMRRACKTKAAIHLAREISFQRAAL